jgi:hypothetical protein
MPKGSAKHAGGAHMTVLNALGALRVKFGEDQSTKKDVGTMAAIKGASTLRNAWAKLKKAGWVKVDGQMVSITDQGMLNVDQEIITRIKAPTNKEHQDSIRAELKGKQRSVFDALIDGLPHAKVSWLSACILVACASIAFRLSFMRRCDSQDEVAEALGMDKTKSTWRNLLASLVKIGIAEYPDKTTSIRLTKRMFPVGLRPGDNE